MQPYFFPYIGYFSLIRASDHFIFFDTPQYERKSWMSRNRILHPEQGSNYINVPTVKAPRETPIREIEINNGERWAARIMAQLEVYKKRAPHYRAVSALLEDFFGNSYDSLYLLNIAGVSLVCDYLDIPLGYDIFGDMELGIKPVAAPDEWSLNITEALGYDRYVNAQGGATFFDRRKFEAAGIELNFLKNHLHPYSQRNNDFEPGLSVIDAMMFCTPEEIVEMMDDYELFD
jgi:hypothetical protein